MSDKVDIRDPGLRDAVDVRVNRSLMAILERLNTLDKASSRMSKVIVLLIVAIAALAFGLTYTVFARNVPFEAVSNSVTMPTFTSGLQEEANAQVAEVEEEYAAVADGSSMSNGIAFVYDADTAVVEVDPWINLRPCSPKTIQVRMFSGTLGELYEYLNARGVHDPEAVERYYAYPNVDSKGITTTIYEIWQLLYLWGPEPENTTSIYGTLLWEKEPYKRIDSLDQVPAGVEVYVYNNNGFLGDGNTSNQIPLDEPFRCYEDLIGTVPWTPEHQLSLHSTSVLTVSYEGQVQDVEMVAYYVGRTLSPAEFRHLYIEHGYYSEPSFVGGDFMRGYYAMNGNRQVMWVGDNYIPDTVGVTGSFTMSRPLPTMREIVVQTVRFHAPYHYARIDITTQRFVIWSVPFVFQGEIKHAVRVILVSEDVVGFDLGFLQETQSLARHLFLDPTEPYIGAHFARPVIE